MAAALKGRLSDQTIFSRSYAAERQSVKRDTDFRKRPETVIDLMAQVIGPCHVLNYGIEAGSFTAEVKVYSKGWRLSTLA